MMFSTNNDKFGTLGKQYDKTCIKLHTYITYKKKYIDSLCIHYHDYVTPHTETHEKGL